MNYLQMSFIKHRKTKVMRRTLLICRRNKACQMFACVCVCIFYVYTHIHINSAFRIYTVYSCTLSSSTTVYFLIFNSFHIFWSQCGYLGLYIFCFLYHYYKFLYWNHKPLKRMLSKVCYVSYPQSFFLSLHYQVGQVSFSLCCCCETHCTGLSGSCPPQTRSQPCTVETVSQIAC